MQILRTTNMFQIWGFMPDAEDHRLLEKWHGPASEFPWEAHLVTSSRHSDGPFYGVLLLEHVPDELLEGSPPIKTHQVACFSRKIFREEAPKKARAAFEDLIAVLEAQGGAGIRTVLEHPDAP